jgi:hypothetical protein
MDYFSAAGSSRGGSDWCDWSRRSYRGDDLTFDGGDNLTLNGGTGGSGGGWVGWASGFGVCVVVDGISDDGG